MSKEEKNKYQDSLNLPAGNFPMRGNLPQQEPKRLEKWQKEDLYGKIRKARSGCPKYVLHDGPPYANGKIHNGTAMNKILKDITIHYLTMQGYDAPYVPGWDCHGLPIEYALLKKLGKTKDEVDQVDFRRQAREYAKSYIDIQRAQFKRFGVLGEWENPYITMDARYEADIIRSFGELYAKGYVYKGCKPIHWCTNCETALAESEIEYADDTSTSIYVKFPLAEGQNLPSGLPKEAAIVIWTTTPWTLPSNRAVCVKSDITYGVVELDGKPIVMAVELVAPLFAKLGKPAPEATAVFQGAELEGLKVKHPIFPDLTVPVVMDDYVSLDTGTGVVHIAPGHGQEDYGVGLRYGLEVFSPVNGKGLYDANVPQYQGMHVFKANEVIIEDLVKKGILIHQEPTTHSYPHCWRCHKPVIFRATDQWFIGVDRNDMRKKALEAIETVKWVPEVSKQRIKSMLELRPDWCLSRQRMWGVPIPVFYCENCGQEILNDEIIKKVGDMAEKETSDIWFSREASELLPEGTVCPKCGGKHFRKEKDILDVWFDSGLSHRAVCGRRENLYDPADMYLEGSDQHRGWFQVSLLTGIGLMGCAPYKKVVTHGWTLTESGEKESKSKGNYTDPELMCNQLGADILRLWVSSTNYMQDVMISENILRQIGDAYRRIRNTFKYILGNIADFDPEKDAVPVEELNELDRYMLHALETLRATVTEAYEKNEYHRVFHALYNFCSVDLSARYCDILKDTLYADAKDSPTRRGAQTVLRQCAVILAKLLAPVLVFTCEEVWECLSECGFSKEEDGEETVHLSVWPKEKKEWLAPELAAKFEKLWFIRDEVLKELEALRQEGKIGSAQEAEVTVWSDDSEWQEILKSYSDKFAKLFIVSGVEVSKPEAGRTVDKLIVSARRSQKPKCARCWNCSDDVGSDPNNPDVCARCAEVLKNQA